MKRRNCVGWGGIGTNRFRVQRVKLRLSWLPKMHVAYFYTEEATDYMKAEALLDGQGPLLPFTQLV